jgi:hypothetical protein
LDARVFGWGSEAEHKKESVALSGIASRANSVIDRDIILVVGKDIIERVIRVGGVDLAEEPSSEVVAPASCRSASG